MFYDCTNPMKDQRTQYNHARIEHEGNVWHIDAKYDPKTKKLRVYRVYGDITNQALLDEAISSWLNAEQLVGKGNQA